MNTANAMLLIALMSAAPSAMAQLSCEQVFLSGAKDFAQDSSAPASTLKPSVDLSVKAPKQEILGKEFDIADIRKAFAFKYEAKIDPALKKRMLDRTFDFVLSPAAAKDPNLTYAFLHWSAFEHMMSSGFENRYSQSPFAMKLKTVLEDPYVLSIINRVDLSTMSPNEKKMLETREFNFSIFLEQALEDMKISYAKKIEVATPWLRLKKRSDLAQVLKRFLTNSNEAKELSVLRIVEWTEPLKKIMTQDELLLVQTDFIADLNNYIGTDTKRPAFPMETVKRMVRENLLHLSGQPFKAVQDVVVSRPSADNGEIVVMLLTSHNVPYGKPFLGFSMRILSRHKAETAKFAEDYKWDYVGTSARVEVSYTPLKLDNLQPPKENSPRYKEMMSDGKVSGLILVSKNLGDFSAELGANYLQYYSRRGYKAKSDRLISYEQAKKEILESVKKGETDWITRDGHHEINTDAIVSFEAQVRVVRLVKGNDVVTVAISLPPKADASGEAKSGGGNLSFDSLGEAMRDRDQKANQIVYFDSACFAARDSAKLISMVSAPGFTPIGSKEIQETFTNTPGTSIFEFLDGMRARHDYEQINAKIKDEAKFILPTDADYISTEEKIWPARVKITRHFKSLFKFKAVDTPAQEQE